VKFKCNGGKNESMPKIRCDKTGKMGNKRGRTPEHGSVIFRSVSFDEMAGADY